MTVNTGIDNSLLRPQTFHTITYLSGNRALQPLPQRLVMIAPQSAAATAIANAVIPVDDPSTVDGNFGIGSYMSLMARKALETAAVIGKGPRLFACPIAEGATKKQETITFVGATTLAGNIVIRIAGRTLTVGVPLGANETACALAVKKAIDAIKAILPFTATVAAGVITLVDVTKGVLGADAIFETVATLPGMAITYLETVAGVGVVDLQPALDAIAGQDFDGVAICNHASADITEIMTHIAATWTPVAKRPRWFSIGEPGSIGTATALAAAANHEGVMVFSWEQSRSLPCEIAAACGVAFLSRTRPNANYDGLTVPLYPPPVSYAYTNAEVETALAAGVTPLVPTINTATQDVIEGVGNIVRMITTRTTLASVPFGLLRDVGISRTTWFMAKQYDLAYAIKFGAYANPDGVLLDDDTEKLVRDMVIGLNYDAQDAKILRNVDNDKQLLVVEPDAVTSGRLDVDSAYTIVVGLHQVAFVHRAYQ